METRCLLFRLRSLAILSLASSTMLVTGCRQDMHDQPKYKPLAASNFFDDGRSARPTVNDTVARGQLRTDVARYQGEVDGKPVEEIPIQITKTDLVRGQQRYMIYCSPCHGSLGDGNGMVVLRGYQRPPNYHSERLRKAPIGHFYSVITNGYGSMISYASRVPVDDRWRISAYIRTLQLSQNAPADAVPENMRSSLQAQSPQTGEAGREK